MAWTKVQESGHGEDENYVDLRVNHENLGCLQACDNWRMRNTLFFFFFASATGRMELSSNEMVKAWGEADLEENKSSVLEISFRCLLDNKANR